MRHPGTAVLRKIVCSVMLGLQITGCTSWRVQQPGPAGLMLSEKPPHLVRVTLTDGSSIVVTNPQLTLDTLRGLSGDDWVRLPVGNIRGVAVRHFNVLRSLGLTAGVVALAGVAAASVALSEWHPSLAHWGQ